jgi:hypothetical protein
LRRAGLVLLVVSVGLLGACGTGGDDGAGERGAAGGGEPSSTGAAAGVAKDGGGGGRAGGGQAPVGDASSLVSARLAVGQRIAQTAELTVRIGDGRLGEALASVARDAERVGGYVVSSTAGTGGADAPESGEVVIRVPAPRFLASVRAAERLGTVVARRIGSEDLTQDYVDTESRLRHARAVEGRLLALLGRSDRVADVLAVQDRLAGVQEQIEVAKGRLDRLAGLTELATITLHLREGAGDPSPAGGWGVRDALDRAAHAAMRVVNAAIVVVGALLPVAVAAALVLLALRSLRGRRRPVPVEPVEPAGRA